MSVILQINCCRKEVRHLICNTRFLCHLETHLYVSQPATQQLINVTCLDPKLCNFKFDENLGEKYIIMRNLLFRRTVFQNKGSLIIYKAKKM